MNEPVWINREFVLVLHKKLLVAHGGADGIRDMGLLESALARPKNLFFYENKDLHALGASYTAGIVKNHPFVDGNKRTGLAVGGIFLERNGLRFIAEEAIATKMVLELASGGIKESEFAYWLTEVTEPTSKVTH